LLFTPDKTVDNQPKIEYNIDMLTQKEPEMLKLKVGNKIRYTSAAGTREAVIDSIEIGPTAKRGFLNTWITLLIPVQRGVKFETRLQIPGDNGSLKGFRVEMA
jgi:hypothetical protein